MPKKKPPESEWLRSIVESMEAKPAYMVEEPTLPPDVVERLTALLRPYIRHRARLEVPPVTTPGESRMVTVRVSTPGPSGMRAVHEQMMEALPDPPQTLPPALVSVAEVVAEVRAMVSARLDATPDYRKRRRTLEALARDCERVYRALSELGREPEGLAFAGRYFAPIKLEELARLEAMTEPLPVGVARHLGGDSVSVPWLGDALVTRLKTSALFVGSAARREAAKLATLSLPRHRRKAGIPRYAVAELAEIWTRETGREANRSGSSGGDGGPFVAFCSIAIRDAAGLKVDVEELVRDHDRRKRGKPPRPRGKKKVLVTKAGAKKKMLVKKEATKSTPSTRSRSRGGRK